MKKTRIFRVEYSYVEHGETEKHGSEFKTSIKLVAKNAADACMKAEGMLLGYEYCDEDSKERIKVICDNFDPIRIELLAETD